MCTCDHQSPADFRATARKERLSCYHTTSFQDSTLTRIGKTVKHEGNFEATTEDPWSPVAEPQHHSIMATGVKDVLPDIEGYHDC